MIFITRDICWLDNEESGKVDKDQTERKIPQVEEIIGFQRNPEEVLNFKPEGVQKPLFYNYDEVLEGSNALEAEPSSDDNKIANEGNKTASTLREIRNL